MSWRVLIISKPSKLSLKHEQLLIQQHDEHGEAVQYTVPMEDIAICVIESLQATITSQCLSVLAKNNIGVIACDETHHPIGTYLPISGHHRQSHIADIQIKASAVTKKRLWQKMVQNKIHNQAVCLMPYDKDGAEYLIDLADATSSGDRSNMEAQAAAFYFKALFGAGFFRGRDDAINNALNYGYAIFRALMARATVASGLMPNYGIFHHNQLNSFNLVDDCMEVFRPFVDQFVRKNQQEILDTYENSLSQQTRQNLASLLTKEVLIEGKMQTCVAASLLYTQMLVRSFKENSAAFLPDIRLHKELEHAGRE